MMYEERCALKKEAASYSETAVPITQSTSRHISEYCDLYHNLLDRIYFRQEKIGWIFGVYSSGYVYGKDQWRVFCELDCKAPVSTNDREFLEKLGGLASEGGLRSRII